MDITITLDKLDILFECFCTRACFWKKAVIVKWEVNNKTINNNKKYFKEENSAMHDDIKGT